MWPHVGVGPHVTVGGHKLGYCAKIAGSTPQRTPVVGVLCRVRNQNVDFATRTHNALLRIVIADKFNMGMYIQYVHMNDRAIC